MTDTPSRPEEPIDSPDRLVRYGFYLVAMIDLLGQRTHLREVARIQWNDPAAAKEKLQKCSGRVRRVRRVLKEFFDLAGTNSTQSPQLTPDQLDEYNRMRQLRFISSGFSDSFVVCVPLGEKEHGRAPSAIAVWSAVYGIAGMSLAAMAEGIPLRGAVDIGFAVDMFPTEVYGPPLLSVYELECTKAEYPRVLIGDGVTRYLGYLGQPKASDGKWTPLIASAADDCRQLVIHAPDDHRPMLHMLSTRLLGTANFIDVAKAAYKWAISERERLKSENNCHLVGYYARLIDYFKTAGFGS